MPISISTATSTAIVAPKSDAAGTIAATSEIPFSQMLANELTLRERAEMKGLPDMPTELPSNTKSEVPSDLDKESLANQSPQTIAELLSSVASVAAMFITPTGFIKPIAKSDSAKSAVELPTSAPSNEAMFNELAMTASPPSKGDLISSVDQKNLGVALPAETEVVDIDRLSDTASIEIKSPTKFSNELYAVSNAVSSNGALTQNTNLNQPALSETAPASLVSPSVAPTVSIPSQTNIASAASIISPRVGTSNWDQALGQKISWMVAGGQQSASLTLNPPDLGPLQVVIHVNNQQADATFIAHQPEVRAALENAIPKLREMMEQSGIQLGDCNVNSQAQQQQEFARNSTPSTLFSTPINEMGQITDLTPAHQPTVIRTDVGLVDTFV